MVPIMIVVMVMLRRLEGVVVRRLSGLSGLAPSAKKGVGRRGTARPHVTPGCTHEERDGEVLVVEVLVCLALELARWCQRVARPQIAINGPNPIPQRNKGNLDAIPILDS